MVGNVKICIWKDFKLILIFPSKSKVLDHSEYIDIHIGKWFKNKRIFCRCPQKNWFFYWCVFTPSLSALDAPWPCLSILLSFKKLQVCIRSPLSSFTLALALRRSLPASQALASAWARRSHASKWVNQAWDRNLALFFPSIHLFHAKVFVYY